MFSHIVIGSNDLDASKAFYDATLGVLAVHPHLLLQTDACSITMTAAG